MDGEINPVLAAGINHTVAGASDEAIADIATQGIPTALISGMTQLANAAESVADVVGLGWGQLEVAKVVHEADDLLNTDLGAYYAKHQEGVDLVGFLGSSLVPGTIGVKALRAAQSGIAIGRSTSIATGLLTNTAEVQLLNRAKTVIESGASISQINKARAAAALARGGQLALEGIAFDMAVFSAMNDNPLLADKSLSEQFKQSVMFGAIFGGLGTGWNYFSQMSKPFTVASGTLAGKQTTLKAIETEVGKALTETAYVPQLAAGAKTTVGVANPQLFDISNPTAPLNVFHGSSTRLTMDDLNNYKSMFQGSGAKADAIYFTTDPSVAATYGAQKNSGLVLNEAVVTPRNPLVLSYEDTRTVTSDVLDKASKEGFDSVLRITSKGEVYEVAVLDKSIISGLNAKNPVTHGDSLVDIARGLQSAAPAVRSELNSAVGNAYSRRVENLQTAAAKAASNLTDDPEVAQAIVTALHTFDPEAIAQIFGGAIKVKSPTGKLAEGTNPFNVAKIATGELHVNLQNGAVSLSPELNLSSMQNVKITKTGASVDGITYKVNNVNFSSGASPIEGELAWQWGLKNPKEMFDLTTHSGLIAAQAAKTVNPNLTVKTADRIIKNDEALVAAELDQAYNRVSFDYLMGNSEAPSWFTSTDWRTYTPPTDKWVSIEYATWQVPSAWHAKGTAEWQQRVTAAQQANRLAVRAALNWDELPALDISSVIMHDQRQSAGLMHSFNAAYESAMEAAGYLGSFVQNQVAALRESRALKMLNAEQALRAAGEKSETSVLFNAVVSRIKGTPDWWRIDTEGKLIYREFADENRNAVTEVLLAADESAAAKTVYEYFAALKSVDAEYLTKARDLDALTGNVKNVPYEDGVYIPPYNLGKTPYIVVVSDPTGSKAILRGRTAEELQDKVRQVRTKFPEYRVYTSNDTDAFFKMRAEWEFEAAFSRTSVDTALRNDGILRDLDVKAGWQELDSINEWLTRKEFSLVRRGVSATYAQEFAEATALSKTLNPFHDTKLAAQGEAATPKQKLGDDAFSTIIKTALNVRDPSAHPYWEYFNQGLNKLYAGTANALWDMGAKLRTGGISVKDANKILQERGVYDAAFTEELWALATKPDFSTAALDAMARVRHLLNTVVLRLDFFNPIVQLVGMPIMLMPAIRDATSAIKSMDQEVPAYRMLATAVKNLFDKDMVDHFANRGIVSKGVTQHAMMVDAAGLMFKSESSARVLEQAGIVQSQFDKFINFMSKPTDWAEHAQRFIAADVGRQIAELRGLVSGTPEYWSFINNFVQKINGTYVAAQRPTLFTGIAGQAVSVFQTYQFNLMQQFAKHLENGDRKTVAMMLGLQGTIYGASSLPAFKLINQHLIGEYNRDNADLYSTAEKYLPDTAGKALMYGLASNMLGAALWSRGDVTPRTPTLIPVTPQDTVAVSMGLKAGNAFMDLISATMGQFKDANPNFKVSVAEAIAHAGVNRPLSGLAEIALGARTSKEGKLDVNLSQHDVLSWATAVRLLGAKPIDEAISMEAYQRQLQYRAAMREKTAAIGEALRSHAMGTGEIPPDTIDKFAEAYTRVGGDIKDFRAAYLRALRDATVPRAQVLAEQMRNSPAAQNYQWALGADGKDLHQFLNGDNPPE